VAKNPTRSEEETYRVHFFIISSAVMALCVWLVYQEMITRRPWRDFQIAWFQVDDARAKKNLEAEEQWLASGTIEVADPEGEETEIEVKKRVEELEK